VASEAKHGDIVPVVADGEDVGGGEAAQGCEVLEGRRFGAAGGKNIQQGEIGFGIGGAVERDLGLGAFVVADRGDEGVPDEQGFSLAHAIDGTAEHHLDWGIGARLECVFDGRDLGNVALVGAHPAADAAVEVVEMLDDEGTTRVIAVGAGEIEGEDEGIAIVVEVGAEPAGGGERQVGAMDEL